MIENICNDVKVYTLNDESEASPAADAVINGKITIVKNGSVYSIVYDPRIVDLTDKVNLLKGRKKEQSMSLVCTYEQGKKIVDRNRVNEDFFRLSPDFCSRVIIRIPVDIGGEMPFPYISDKGTCQFIDFANAHPVNGAFTKELAKRGCEYLSITSANINSEPTIEDLESAKKLAILFNQKALSLGMQGIETVVVDIPSNKGFYKGSYIILSFCEQSAIEVKRLANKKDREVTERQLTKMFANVQTMTPLVYALT